MKLKYQQLLNELDLNSCCPPKETFETDIDAFRWVYSPIENDLNLLPNKVYNDIRKIPTRALTKEDLCKNCNMSFFTDYTVAYSKLELINQRFEKKHKDLLNPFYTDIAQGTINKIDGLVTKIENNHFMLYEYEGSNLRDKFKIVEIK